MARTMRDEARSLDNAEYLNYSRNQCLLCDSTETRFEDRIVLNGNRVVTLYCENCKETTRTMLKDG